jgi:chemotaxis signal transduction protein
VEPPEFHPGKYLTFRLAGQEFAVAAARVKGIVPLHDMEPVEPDSNAPEGLLGRAAVRGQPFEVMDLARSLGLARRVQGRNPYIIVVEGLESRGIRGFPVDRVCDVILARTRDYSHGKLRIGRPRRVLDADRLFSAEPQRALAETTP